MSTQNIDLGASLLEALAGHIAPDFPDPNISVGVSGGDCVAVHLKGESDLVMAIYVDLDGKSVHVKTGQPGGCFEIKLP